MKHLSICVLVGLLSLSLGTDASAKKVKKADDAPKTEAKATATEAPPAETVAAETASDATPDLKPFIGTWKVMVDDKELEFIRLAKAAVTGDEAADAAIKSMHLTTEQEEVLGLFVLFGMMGAEAGEALDGMIAAMTEITVTFTPDTISFAIPGAGEQAAALKVLGAEGDVLNIEMTVEGEPSMTGGVALVEPDVLEMTSEGKPTQRFKRVP